MKFKGSAHGKLILFGEHSVVHGHRAIAMPIKSLETRVVIERGIDPNIITINDRVIDIRDYHQPSLITSPLEYLIFEKILSAFLPKEFWNIHISIESNIPIGEGLGSSAALCVAMSNAFKSYATYHLQSMKFDIDPNDLESVFHGRNPSGIDVATCLSFTPIIFQKKKVISKLEECISFKVMIISSGITRSTREVLEGLSARGSSLPLSLQGTDETIKNIGELTSQINHLNDHEQLIKLTRENHKLLQDLRVTEPRIDEFIQMIWDKYRIPGKITGAGCGGCFYLLLLKGGEGEEGKNKNKSKRDKKENSENKDENHSHDSGDDSKEIIKEIKKEIQGYKGFRLIAISS